MCASGAAGAPASCPGLPPLLLGGQLAARPPPLAAPGGLPLATANAAPPAPAAAAAAAEGESSGCWRRREAAVRPEPPGGRWYQPKLLPRAASLLLRGAPGAGCVPAREDRREPPCAPLLLSAGSRPHRWVSSTSSELRLPGDGLGWPAVAASALAAAASAAPGGAVLAGTGGAAEYGAGAEGTPAGTLRGMVNQKTLPQLGLDRAPIWPPNTATCSKAAAEHPGVRVQTTRQGDNDRGIATNEQPSCTGQANPTGSSNSG